MSSNEKSIHFLGDRKEEVVTAPLSEKKPSTKDVEKNTSTLCRLMEQLWPLTGNPLAFFLFLVVYINCMYSSS